MNKLLSFLLVLSFILHIFSLTSYALNDKQTEPSMKLKYNGTVEELPDRIYCAYQNNDKAESIDIYDDNLFSLTMNNTDGTKTTEIFQTKIKYIEDDEIKFINTALEEINILGRIISKNRYQCVNTPVKSYYPQRIEDGIIIEKDGYEIVCAPMYSELFNKSSDSGGVVLSENMLHYNNVFTGDDTIIYSPLSNGVKEEIVLDSYIGKNTFEFTINLTGLEPVCMAGESIPLVDIVTKEQVAAISQVDVKDSSPQFKTSLYNSIELYKTDENTYTLKLIIDEAFLTSETTTYPVVIDPTITFYSSSIKDSPVYSGYPSTNYNANTYNIVGYHGASYGEGITFIQMNNLQNYKGINEANVTNAYLRVYEGSGKTTSAKVNLFNCMQLWNDTTVTYNNMPTLASTAYSSNTITSSGWYNFNITALLKGWMKYEVQDGGKSQQYGVALKMASTGVSSRHFASANNSSYSPSVVVTYTPDTSIKTGDYFIQSQYYVSGNHCYLQASSDHTNVVQYTGTGYSTQIWKITALGNGEYSLRPKANTSKYMGTATTSPVNGTNVELCTDSSSNRIRFKLLKNSDGTYRIMSVCSGGNKTGLSVYGPNQSNNTNIQAWDYSGATHQRWKFYPAAPQGRLEYWYCDSNLISYQTNRNLKVCVETLDGFGKSLTTLKSYVGNGFDKWSSLGVSYTFVSSPADCHIYVRGVTRAQAINNNYCTALDAAGATTAIDNEKTISTYMGNVWSPLGWKNTYSVNYKEVYIVWDNGTGGGVKNSNYSTEQWEVIVIHEIGHALGYEGHTETITSNMSIMDAYHGNAIAYNQTVPNANNLKHLRQVY